MHYAPQNIIETKIHLLIGRLRLASPGAYPIRRPMSLRVLVPWPQLFEALRLPGIEPILWQLDDEHSIIPEADVLITERPTNLAHRAHVRQIKDLKHVHLLSIGYEWILEHLPANVGLSNSRGAVEDATAEHCVALILAATRELPTAIKQQNNSQWQRLWTGSLHGSNVLILGAGGVGSEIISRLKPFKPSKITTVARSARTTDEGQRIHGLDELDVHLPLADIVIIALPHTPDTEGMIEKKFLSLMHNGALLVNIGRGALVDTEALLHELELGRLRAALDVTYPEPLPVDHRLWQAPSCLITPHMGGDTTEFLRLATNQAVQQVLRILEGQQPLNLVLDRHPDLTPTT